MCINRFSNRFTNQVRVIAPEVIKDNWDRRLPCFDLKLKITGIVSWSLKLTCNMAVVPDLVVNSKFSLHIQQVFALANFFLSSPVSIRSCLIAKTLLILTNSLSILQTNSCIAFFL